MSSSYGAEESDEVNPTEVSSTKASASLECERPDGAEKFIRSGTMRSRVWSSTTTRDNQTAGDAPLPWPVPKSGSTIVPT
jgi:hypothetical protein